MKNYLLAVATVAAFAFSNSTAFAACADEIQVQEARMAAQQAQGTALPQWALGRLQEAKNLCDRGDDDRATAFLNELKNLLDRAGL